MQSSIVESYVAFYFGVRCLMPCVCQKGIVRCIAFTKPIDITVVFLLFDHPFCGYREIVNCNL